MKMVKSEESWNSAHQESEGRRAPQQREKRMAAAHRRSKRESTEKAARQAREVDWVQTQ